MCIHNITTPAVNIDTTLAHPFSPFDSVFFPIPDSVHTTTTDHNLSTRTLAAAGWIIFLSIVVLFYQAFAVAQMFLYIPLLYKKIPIHTTSWYLFSLIVSYEAIFGTIYVVMIEIP